VYASGFPAFAEAASRRQVASCGLAGSGFAESSAEGLWSPQAEARLRLRAGERAFLNILLDNMKYPRALSYRVRR